MRPRSVVLAAALTLAACSDALEQDTTAGLVIAVVNTGSNSLSFVSASAFTSDLGADLTPPTGTPATLDARGSLVIVPMGTTNALRVYSFGTLTGPEIIALPTNSGATGVAVENDSLAWVANPNLNSVTVVNYLTGDTVTRAAGTYPQAVAVTDPYVFVVNGNLTGGQPAGPSSLRWFTRSGAGPILASGTTPLSCTNARAAAVGSDGLLYVVCAGTVGDADGKLSIVDPVALREVAVLNGLGESPGPAVYHPSGRLLVASATAGILEVNTLTRSVTRGPGDGIKPSGDGIAGLAVDPRGRVYAVAPGACSSPGRVHVLSAPPEYRSLATPTVGVCPAAAALAAVPLID